MIVVHFAKIIIEIAILLFGERWFKGILSALSNMFDEIIITKFLWK